MNWRGVSASSLLARGMESLVCNAPFLLTSSRIRCATSLARLRGSSPARPEKRPGHPHPGVGSLLTGRGVRPGPSCACRVKGPCRASPSCFFGAAGMLFFAMTSACNLAGSVAVRSLTACRLHTNHSPGVAALFRNGGSLEAAPRARRVRVVGRVPECVQAGERPCCTPLGYVNTREMQA
jgi:hypothetical protein